jgi:hypothetical protein
MQSFTFPHGNINDLPVLRDFVCALDLKCIRIQVKIRMFV